jgi:hypothetical protein
MKHFAEPPEAIILTMPVAWFRDRNMSYADFCKDFEATMAEEDNYWNFLKSNLPTQDVAYVYLVFDGFVQYRANFVCYERNVAKAFDDAPDGIVREFPPSNWILFSGPVIKAPFDIPMKGFQGHRYSKMLF